MVRKKKSNGKEPLPGERQGTSGAAAGGDSGRAGSDHALSRRALIGQPEENTAEETIQVHKEEVSEENRTRESQPGPSELQENSEIGNTNERMKWTIEEYKEIMWCFYYNKETTGTTNLKDTYKIWRERNPNTRININSNTLATQRRYIVNKNKLSEYDLNSIKEEVLTFITSMGNNEPQELNDDNRRQADEIVEGVNEVRENVINTRQKNEQHNKGNNGNNQEDIKIKIQRGLNRMDNNIEARNPLPRIRDTKEIFRLISQTNKALKEIIIEKYNNDVTLTELNKIIYTAGQIITEEIIPKRSTATRKRKREKPPWKTRIGKKIEILRKEISQIVEIINGNNSDRMQTITNSIYRKYKLKNKEDCVTLLEILKQKLQAKAQRIERYEKRSKFYHQNKMFTENPARFYRELKKKNNPIEQSPPLEEIETFWKGIWEDEKEHNKKAKWVKSEKEKYKDTPKMKWNQISEEEVKNAIDKTANWKTPGPDGIHNYWLKKFSSIHIYLADCYNKIITGVESCPEWLTKGNTYLLAKNKNTKQAKNYRPITCLTTIYKNLTSIIASRIQIHLNNNKMFPSEQKGCAQNSYGTKDHLLVSRALIEDCKKKKKNMSIGWIDYQKAFDSVPHTWLLEVLKIYRISDSIIEFIRTSMKEWKVDLNLTTKNEDVKVKNIRIKKGIFQGDSLSPLVFCMSLIPLTTLLNQSDTGYQIKRNHDKINHLVYVDDLKLIAKNDKELENQIKIVKNFSADIQMEFGLDKCAKVTFVKGKLQSTENITIDETTEIKELEQEHVYKYLGVDEKDGIQDEEMKTKIRREYYRRVRAILKTELNSKNKTIAITSLAVPVILYSIGIVKWTKEEIRKLDAKTRKLLTMHSLLHPRADVSRLYVPRTDGGRGFTQIELMFTITSKSLANYLKLKKNDKLLSIIYDSEIGKIEKVLADETEEEKIENTAATRPETKRVKEIKNKIKQRLTKEMKKNWKDKPLHGQFLKETQKEHVDQYVTWNWLQSGEIKGETEALITSAQDQAIATNYYKTKILHTSEDPRCRLCKTENETVQHIISGCPILAKKQYLERHNAVASHLHWNICRNFNIETTEKWYLHQPKPVVDSPGATIIWDMQVQTDRHIPANKPDIIIKDKTNNKCLIIDVAIPSDYNITQKEAEKAIKYRDLEIEIQRMWHMKTKVIPVIIGATGVVSKTAKKMIEEIPGKHNLKQMQKTVILKTAHIIRKTI